MPTQFQPLNPPTKEDIFKYYVSDSFNPELPFDSPRRHFRFKVSDGTWRKSKFILRTEDDLRLGIVKLGALDIFYSTSRWLIPNKISTKGSSGTYFVANNCLLGNDLIFDIDEETSIAGLDRARKSAWNIYHAMQEFKQFKFIDVVFTGSKGFRLTYRYDGEGYELPPNAKHRLDALDRNRKIFIDSLQKELSFKKQGRYSVKPEFDENVSLNPMSVVRVIGTVNSKTGFVVTKITPSMLRKPITSILNHIPYVGKARPGIPDKREMTKGGKESLTPRPRPELNGEGCPWPPILLQPLKPLTYYVTNRVPGIKKGYVPIFVYPKAATYWEKDVKRLQTLRKLGHLYVFSDIDNRYVVSLKVMQKRQLQKLLTESASRTKIEFKKTGRICLPLALDFEIKIHGDHTGHLSRGHVVYVDPNYANPHGFCFCGWGQLELIAKGAPI